MPYVLALLGVALIGWLTTIFLPILGLASAALLFLLPVLFASARGGTGPGLVAALAGAAAYNFLLLPPRFTLRVHGFDNVISVVAFFSVALVTSRLSIRLQAQRNEAEVRAQESREAADLAAVLGNSDSDQALANGTAWLEERFGPASLIARGEPSGDDGRFSSLDLSAAAWAMHNGDMTGHGTAVMPAADWTFLPLSPHNRGEGHVVALARPASGRVRGEPELAHIRQLVFLLGQAWDRAALGRERRERERLKDSEDLRRSLLASLAHDLRTPLTVVIGRLREMGSAVPEAAETLAAARRIGRMMEDLLGAARIESGHLAPNMESLDLVDVVSTACAAASAPSEIAIERTIPNDLPLVRGDATLLHHVLLNLIDNAVRHARSRIMISATAASGNVRLTVADDGPGIPPQERERIFERFVRIEGTDRTHGSGLGLAIVKGFADAMGIGVEAKGTPSGGACFALRLPLASVGRAA